MAHEKHDFIWLHISRMILFAIAQMYNARMVEIRAALLSLQHAMFHLIVRDVDGRENLLRAI